MPRHYEVFTHQGGCCHHYFHITVAEQVLDVGLTECAINIKVLETCLGLVHVCAQQAVETGAAVQVER